MTKTTTTATKGICCKCFWWWIHHRGFYLGWWTSTCCSKLESSRLLFGWCLAGDLWCKDRRIESESCDAKKQYLFQSHLKSFWRFPKFNDLMMFFDKSLLPVGYVVYYHQFWCSWVVQVIHGRCRGPGATVHPLARHRLLQGHTIGTIG